MSILGLYVEEYNSNLKQDWRFFMFRDHHGEFDLYGSRRATTPKKHRKADNYTENDVYLHFKDRRSLLRYLEVALELNGGTMSFTFSQFDNLTETDFTFHAIREKHNQSMPKHELFGYDNELITMDSLKKLVKILEDTETW